MSNQSCGQCPALQAEISRLCQVIAGLQRRIVWLERQIGVLLGAVVSSVHLLRAERDKPSMPKTRLLQAVWGRLETAVEQLEVRI